MSEEEISTPELSADEWSDSESDNERHIFEEEIKEQHSLQSTDSSTFEYKPVRGRNKVKKYEGIGGVISLWETTDYGYVKVREVNLIEAAQRSFFSDDGKDYIVVFGQQCELLEVFDSVTLEPRISIKLPTEPLRNIQLAYEQHYMFGDGGRFLFVCGRDAMFLFTLNERGEVQELTEIDRPGKNYVLSFQEELYNK